jgi:uncharacterized protein YciI
MKNPLLLVTALVVLQACGPVTPPAEPGAAAEPGAKYDSAYAERLGADDYGMKSYVMAFLKRGPNRDRDSSEAAALQRAHLENIGRLAEAGKLVLAGPFLDTGALRGIYLFDVPTVEEARALTATDPAIQAGSLVMELKPWYGSAALMEVNHLHRRLEKTGIAE